MKPMLFCLVLAVSASFAIAVVIWLLHLDPKSSSDLTSGGISVGDQLLSRKCYTKSPLQDYYQFTIVFYSTRTIITSIHAEEVGFTQFATAIITEGGVGHHNVTIILATAVSRGFHYMIEVWGH